MEISLLKEIIEALEVFEKENTSPKQPTINEFVWWLNVFLTAQSVEKSLDVAIPNFQENSEIDIDISKYITYMGRYSRFYTKQALVGSKLSTADDFVYLAVLFKYGSMSKTALIQYNIQEKTTGVEVIKRLLKNGFISQSNHETDRRSKQVSISEKGQRELFSVFGKMDKVSQMIGGDLTQNEKILLLGLLKKLNDFHEFSFTSEKQLEFE